MRTHCVQRGECVASIAARYGVGWREVWDHPQNAELRRLRGDPGVLRVGDNVAVPEPPPAPMLSPGGTTRFTARVPMVELRLSLGDEQAAVPYRIIAGSRSIEGTTDGDGGLVAEVPAHAGSAQLILDPGTETERAVGLNIGELDPADTPGGSEQRLSNLGYNDVRTFQQAQGLEPSGDLDDDTRARIEELHG